MTKIKTQNFQDQVYRIVKLIPKGKVVTYGYIANLIRLRGERSLHLEGGIAARAVGNALHLNKSADVPCHRVVDRDGRIAINFGFGGWKQHRKRLLAEGVKFRGKMHVDLELCRWQEN